MTIQISGYTPRPFIGNPQTIASKAISLCRPNSAKPSVISFVIDWSVYTNGAVSINLDGMTVANPLDMIKGLAIDNTNCSNTVIAQFPDTNYPIVCQGEATVAQEALTNNLQVIVYNISGVQAGITTVWLTNVQLNSSLLPQQTNTVLMGLISSSAIGTTQLANPYVLGETYIRSEVRLTIAGNTALLPVQTAGSYVITSVRARVFACLSNIGPLTLSIAIVNGGTTIFQYQVIASGSIYTDDYRGKIISERSGLQIHLNATHGVVAAITNPFYSGQMEFECTFSWIASGEISPVP